MESPVLALKTKIALLQMKIEAFASHRHQQLQCHPSYNTCQLDQ
uniref:Uncharacterized protein n=1 Tax=Rhizophora mucronata TaxID=61149 RepID=A0A2P2PI87_RHIMU